MLGLERPSLVKAWRRRTRGFPEQMVDLLLRTGVHRLSLEKLAQHPHGLDLGPLQPGRAERVRTRDRKVQLAPLLMADLGRLSAWVAHPTTSPASLVLIGRRHLRSNNSWMHNLRSLVKGPSRAQAWMNPRDAQARAILDGRVRLTSRTGSIELEVRLTEDVQPGAVSVPHGFGHQAGVLSVAGGLAPNVNALTDEALVEPVPGNSILTGVPIEASPV